jgi:PGF-pre-PGF domain-containing protein
MPPHVPQITTGIISFSAGCALSTETINMWINSTQNANQIGTYGTNSVYIAQFTNSLSTCSYNGLLYVNGKLEGNVSISGTTPTNVTFSGLESAGLYTIVANQTATSTSETHSQTINKAVPTITLTATRANFTYNGTTENISGSVSSVNSQVSGSLYINGLLESSLYKNATAGIWSAWFNTTANQNYSAAQSHIARQIYKATLTQTLSSSPTSPFTYDGSAPTITDTLSGTLVSGQSGLSFALGNDSLSTGSTGSSTLSSSSFTFSALGGKYASAGPYSYTSTSSGDQNYTIMNSPPLTITISKATPAMSLLSAPGNFTYNGTEDAFTGAVTSVDDQLSGELYVNGTLKTGPYSTATVGVYKAVFNTSGNRNYSAASSKVSVSILLAVPALLCASKPGNFIENGTQENLTCKIDTVDNQLAADLYINYSNSLGSRWMKYINQTNNDISYYNSSWGGYTAIFNTSGDQNYTGFSVNRSSVIRLERAIITVTPPPTSQPTNNTLNSSSSAANNSHLAGTNPSGVNTQKVLTNRTNLNETNFGDHIVEVYLNTSVQNDAVTLDLSKVVPSSNFYIPITGSGVGVTGLIGISMDENINTSNVKLNVTKVSDATCFGGNLPAPVSFVNITTPFNESKISQVIYYFEVSKQQLAAANLSASEISRYRCNPETHEWQELPTYFVSQNSTTVIYKAISPSFSLYGSAKGQTIMPQNTSSANSHKKNATSGKQAQLVEVQSLIPTKASDPGFLFSFMAIGAIALPLLSMVVYRKICTVR